MQKVIVTFLVLCFVCVAQATVTAKNPTEGIKLSKLDKGLTFFFHPSTATCNEFVNIVAQAMKDKFEETGGWNPDRWAVSFFAVGRNCSNFKVDMGTLIRPVFDYTDQDLGFIEVPMIINKTHWFSRVVPAKVIATDALRKMAEQVAVERPILQKVK